MSNRKSIFARMIRDKFNNETDAIYCQCCGEKGGMCSCNEEDSSSSYYTNLSNKFEKTYISDFNEE